MSLTSSSIEELQHFIQEGAYSLETSRFSAVAVFTLAIYDWLLCLREEYDLIHRSRWTFIKVAYLFCRYYPLLVAPLFTTMWLGDHTYQTCSVFIHPFYVLIVPCLAAQAVMIIRAHGFTAHNKVYLGILLAAFCAAGGAEFWLFGTQFIASKDQYTAFGPKTACFGNDIQVEVAGNLYEAATHTGLVMLASFLVDFLVILFVSIHCIRTHTSQGRLGRTFIAQGLASFLIMAAVNLLTSILYLQSNRIYNGVGLPFAFILPDIIACRVVLHLRRVVAPTETQGLIEQSRIVREGIELLDLHTAKATQNHADPGLQTRWLEKFKCPKADLESAPRT